MHEAHASAKLHTSAGASASPAIVARPTRDMRWRASFAVQLYEALGDPGFGALQPWLFETPLQKLQPLVQRFWHVANLGLMEKLLRFVVEHDVRLAAIEAALKGWHKGKAGQPASIIDAHQHTALLHDFQQRVGLYNMGVRQLTGRRSANGQPSSTPTVTNIPTPPASVLELFAQSPGGHSTTRRRDSPPRLDDNLASLAETSAGAFPAAPAAAAAAASPAEELEAAAVESSSEADEEDSNDALSELEAAARVQLSAHAVAAAAAPATNASPLRPRRLVSSPPSAEASADAKTVRTRAAAGNTAQRSPPVSADAKVQSGRRDAEVAAVASAQRVVKRKRAPSRGHESEQEPDTPAVLQPPAARIRQTKAIGKPQEDADDDTSDVNQSADQLWRESCAEQFVQLLQRYPYQLTRAHPLEVDAADSSLESAALVVRGLDMLPASASTSSVEAVQQELDDALKDTTSPKVILQLPDDADAAFSEPEVRGAHTFGTGLARRKEDVVA